MVLASHRLAEQLSSRLLQAPWSCTSLHRQHALRCVRTLVRAALVEASRQPHKLVFLGTPEVSKAVPEMFHIWPPLQLSTYQKRLLMSRLPCAGGSHNVEHTTQSIPAARCVLPGECLPMFPVVVRRSTSAVQLFSTAFCPAGMQDVAFWTFLLW